MTTEMTDVLTAEELDEFVNWTGSPFVAKLIAAARRSLTCPTCNGTGEWREPASTQEKLEAAQLLSIEQFDAEKKLSVGHLEAREGGQELLILVPIIPTDEMWNTAENASMALSVALDHNATKEQIAKEVEALTCGLVKDFDPFDYPTMRIANLVLGYMTMIAVEADLTGRSALNESPARDDGTHSGATAEPSVTQGSKPHLEAREGGICPCCGTYIGVWTQENLDHAEAEGKRISKVLNSLAAPSPSVPEETAGLVTNIAHWIEYLGSESPDLNNFLRELAATIERQAWELQLSRQANVELICERNEAQATIADLVSALEFADSWAEGLPGQSHPGVKDDVRAFRNTIQAVLATHRETE